MRRAVDDLTRPGSDPVDRVVSDRRVAALNGLELQGAGRDEHPFLAFAGKESRKVASEAFAGGEFDA